MSWYPADEERELKIDILKTVLDANAVAPNAIAIEEIVDGVANHEAEVVARWIRDLCENRDCPLDYYSDEMTAVTYRHRVEAVEYIDEIQQNPWYQEDLD